MSLRRPFIADAVFADCGGSPYTVNAAAALTLGRSVQIPERPGEPQLRKNCSSFISSVAPPGGITTIGAIPGLRKAPLLRERQDGARAPAARHCTSTLRALPTGKAAWSFR